MDPDSFMTIYGHISTRGLARLGIPTGQLRIIPRVPLVRFATGAKRETGAETRDHVTLVGIRHLLHCQGGLRPPVLYGNEI